MFGPGHLLARRMARFPRRSGISAFKPILVARPSSATADILERAGRVKGRGTSLKSEPWLVRQRRPPLTQWRLPLQAFASQVAPPRPRSLLLLLPWQTTAEIGEMSFRRRREKWSSHRRKRSCGGRRGRQLARRRNYLLSERPTRSLPALGRRLLLGARSSSQIPPRLDLQVTRRSIRLNPRTSELP